MNTSIRKTIAVGLTATVLLASASLAEISVSRLFSDHMVLQHDKPIKL